MDGVVVVNEKLFHAWVEDYGGVDSGNGGVVGDDVADVGISAGEGGGDWSNHDEAGGRIEWKGEIKAQNV